MIVSFGAMLLARDIWVLIASQAVFGLAIGLIYYSSLFYSMDVGETKGEHGGIHEAAIGAGNATWSAMAVAAAALFSRNFPAAARRRTAFCCSWVWASFIGCAFPARNLNPSTDERPPAEHFRAG